MKHQKLTTTSQISERMAKIHVKGSKAETLLAKALWKQGFRYLKNYKKLPGSPDIAITKYQIAVFVDGEFWHGKDWVRRKEKIKSNQAYWIEKIEENILRDKRIDMKLKEMGWTSLRFWEKEVNKNLVSCVNKIVEISTTGNSALE